MSANLHAVCACISIALQTKTSYKRPVLCQNYYTFANLSSDSGNLVQLYTGNNFSPQNHHDISKQNQTYGNYIVDTGKFKHESIRDKPTSINNQAIKLNDQVASPLV